MSTKIIFDLPCWSNLWNSILDFSWPGIFIIFRLSTFSICLKWPLFNLISLGKEVFEKRKAEGFAEYQQYATWDDMIAKYTKERMEQNVKKKRDPRDTENSVLYKL